MKIINFKGNCLFHENTNFKLNNKEIDYLQTLKLENNPPHKFFFSTNIFIFNNPILSRLKELFDYYSNLYVKDVLELENDIKITNSWLTINKSESLHHPHKHFNSFLSVCFYPQVESGNIYFQIEKTALEEAFHFKYTPSKPNEFNSKETFFNLTSGDIVIFPSWLTHYTKENKSLKDRIMVGANYYFKERFEDIDSWEKF